MTGKVLLAGQPDWRSRQRQAAAAATPPAWRHRETVEFDETESDHAGNDGGWTVGYLDVLLLLVTLFAALLGATYLQMNQLRSAQAAEIEPVAALASTIPARPAAAPDPELSLTDTDPLTATGSAPAAEAEPEASPSEEPPYPVATATGTAPEGVTEAMASAPLKVTESAATAKLAPAVTAPQSVIEADAGRDPVMPPQFQALMDLVAARSERQDLELLLDHHQLRLEVGDGILFASGTAELGTGGRALIEELVTALVDDRLRISVEGHTDNVPINTARFPSNWELSSIRATTVARELIAHGIPQQRIRVTGYADTRPRASNDTAANRALNRRVSLVLEVSEEVLTGSY